MVVNPVVVASAIGAALGLMGLVFAVSGRSSHLRARTSEPGRSVDIARLMRRVVPALGAALITLVLTRWPVAAVLVAFAVGYAPSVMGRTSASVAAERIEAIAVWTELLRDTLAASAGIGEAILATAPVAPLAIREQVVRLADRLASGIAMSEAIRAFADEVDDPSCDMVACALLLAATSRAQRLADLLGALSDSIREEVAMRLRVEASRASARSSVRTIVVFSLLFAALLMAIAHSYLSPLGSPVGQVVLAAVGACYAGGIALMVRLVRPPAQLRILAPAPGVGRADRKGRNGTTSMNEDALS